MNQQSTVRGDDLFMLGRNGAQSPSIEENGRGHDSCDLGGLLLMLNCTCEDPGHVPKNTTPFATAGMCGEASINPSRT